MRLTFYTDYSLRMLMYLALKPDGLATVGEVARAYQISRGHLTKVAHQLGLAGYIESVRGRRGGLRLARPAETIGIGDVVRRTEPDMALAPCFPPTCAPCPIRPACGLVGALAAASEAFLRTLDGYTLASLVTERGAMIALTAGNWSSLSDSSAEFL